MGVANLSKSARRSSEKNILSHDHMLSDVSSVDSGSDLAVGLDLGFEAIAVFIKNQIHTALFIA